MSVVHVGGLGSVVGVAIQQFRHVADGLVVRYQTARLETRSSGAVPTLLGPGDIVTPELLTCEANVFIGTRHYFNCGGGLSIGANTHISRQVTIYTINHEYEGTALPYDDSVRRRPVQIGRNCWIGMGVTILPGSSIGHGAIIGAGAVVAGAVPPLALVGSPPQIALGSRDEEHYDRLESSGAYGGRNGLAAPAARSHDQ